MGFPNFPLYMMVVIAPVYIQEAKAYIDEMVFPKNMITIEYYI